MTGTRCYVAVGSNLDPVRMVCEALGRLSRELGVAAVSTFYVTPALGPPGRPDFLNGVVAIETALGPRQLKFDVLRRIEEAQGRQRSADRYAPRPIDLDLLLHGSLVCSEPDLVLPDPDIERRLFVAAPLLELAPELVLPGSGRLLSEIVASLRQGGAELRPHWAVPLPLAAGVGRGS